MSTFPADDLKRFQKIALLTGYNSAEVIAVSLTFGELRALLTRLEFAERTLGYREGSPLYLKYRKAWEESCGK